jgi:hypothetical protein
LKNGTALLAGVSTGAETTEIYMLFKFREAILQPVLMSDY